MAFIPVADVVELELFQRLHGQNIENTLYFRNTGGYGQSEMTNLWNVMLVWWNTNLAPNLSSDITLRGGKVTDLSSNIAQAYEFNAPTPNPAGDVSSPALPGNVALCVSFRTGNRGRSYRGRNYVAGLAEASVVGNTVDTGAVTGIQTAYSSIIGLPFDDPWEWVVVSRFTANAPRVAGVATLITTASVVDPYIDSMRTRLTGRGT